MLYALYMRLALQRVHHGARNYETERHSRMKRGNARRDDLRVYNGNSVFLT